MPPLTRKRKAEVESVKDGPELPHNLGWKPDPSKVEFVKPAPKRVKRQSDSEELTSTPVKSSPSLKTVAKKAIKYHFTPGLTPYPNHLMPTPEACEEVNRILSDAHGKVEAPKIIATPSMKVAGCGQVPDLLDALIRTRLSATTSSTNANRALEGLQKAYGLQTTGPGKGSINWDAVRRSDIPAITEAIKRGGHQNVKSVDIKVMLDTVYAQNVARLEFLRHGTKSEDTDNVKLEEEPASQEAKALEITKLEGNMLSLDRIMRMKPFEAMEEMMKFKGIGVKTSSCVLLFCMKIPSFAVDTHVWRHCKWLGWVPEKANRDQTYSHCEVRVPDHLKYSLHQLLIMHGKKCYRCKSNTSYGTAKWNQTVCPIEHLVSRMGPKKQPGHVSPKKEVVKIEKVAKATKSPSKKVVKTKRVKKEVESDSEQELSELSEVSESEPGEDAED
ncbi:DNA glycosylase [Rhexocercosporidium sp. MPI-PUGE-AT-0058]|nr:DNA glycosylase [Rhexocercosporidium sp. MPI-PUGE-AT-0058]